MDLLSCFDVTLWSPIRCLHPGDPRANLRRHVLVEFVVLQTVDKRGFPKDDEDDQA
jgi:hypothetical protein